jgi:hypothetical protein
VKDISEKPKLSEILTLNETYPEDFRASEPNRKGIHNRRSIVSVAAIVAEAAARVHRHHQKGGLPETSKLVYVLMKVIE